MHWGCDRRSAVARDAASSVPAGVRPSVAARSAHPTAMSTWGSRSNRACNGGIRCARWCTSIWVSAPSPWGRWDRGPRSWNARIDSDTEYPWLIGESGYLLLRAFGCPSYRSFGSRLRRIYFSEVQAKPKKSPPLAPTARRWREITPCSLTGAGARSKLFFCYEDLCAIQYRIMEDLRKANEGYG